MTSSTPHLPATRSTDFNFTTLGACYLFLSPPFFFLLYYILLTCITNYMNKWNIKGSIISTYIFIIIMANIKSLLPAAKPCSN
ncbi:hypothetical protein E2C01_041156 [Portunus trituberculatus]|uniref:Uncharacterized protein n=1 Tax=Portunus trituberculatus TaxID=210409 RepID=A0A5B7FJ97_PORTR|nr:hypothetical protein [Portunus trituberculatus]